MNKKLLEFCFNILELKNTIRTGWKEVGIPREKIETIGEHISTTLLMSAAIIKEYNIDNLDELKVFKMIMIKELVKIVKGEQSVIDVSNRKTEDRDILLFLTNGLNIQNELINLYDEAIALQSEEAKFVLCISKLESDIQAKAYEINGDFTLQNALKDIENYPENIKNEIKPQVVVASDGWNLFDRRYYKDNELFIELSKEVQSINRNELEQDSFRQL